jgi:hypothetical protein
MAAGFAGGIARRAEAVERHDGAAVQKTKRFRFAVVCM